MTKGLGTALLTLGAALLLDNTSIVVAAADANEQTILDGGGLRRKRITARYNSNHEASSSSSSHRRLSNVDEELAQRFFLPNKENNNPIDEIDMRELLVQMNLDLCFSTTQAPTLRPTQSIAPTATSCDNPGTCENRLRDQIYAISVRVGSVETLDDPNSAQSKATEWIVEECGADPPIDPCDVNQIMLNEQRYALAVMYFSLGGDNWNSGSNAGQVADNAEVGAWMTGKNYCEWGPEIEAQGGDKYKQLVCDEFGNVQQLNLRKFGTCVALLLCWRSRVLILWSITHILCLPFPSYQKQNQTTCQDLFHPRLEFSSTSPPTSPSSMPKPARSLLPSDSSLHSKRLTLNPTIWMGICSRPSTLVLTV